MVLDDLAKLVNVGGPQVSPDGMWLAITSSRPGKAKRGEFPNHLAGLRILRGCAAAYCQASIERFMGTEVERQLIPANRII